MKHTVHVSNRGTDDLHDTHSHRFRREPLHKCVCMCVCVCVCVCVCLIQELKWDTPLPDFGTPIPLFRFCSSPAHADIRQPIFVSVRAHAHCILCVCVCGGG